jgi:hypothetical protein
MIKCMTVVMALSFGLYGQMGGAQKSKPQPLAASQSQQQLSELQAQVASLEKRVKSLETRAEVLPYLLGNKQDRITSVTLDVSQHVFQRLDTEVGSLLILLDDVSPYLNGYKVRLRIGNPSDADFADVKIKTKWSKQYQWDKYDEVSYKEWESHLHEGETSLAYDLQAGAWNKVELILIPAAPEELGYLSVSVEANSVKMTTREVPSR